MLPQASLRGVHTPVRSLPLRHAQVRSRPQHEGWRAVPTPSAVRPRLHCSVSGKEQYSVADLICTHHSHQLAVG